MRTGTWRWAGRTGGSLRWRDHLDQRLRAARLRVLARRGQLVADHVTVARQAPDSAFARTAWTTARAVSSDVLLGHCLRAWLWADLVAQAEHVRHDPELLYVACLLHDLGLSPTYWCQRAQCFGVEGAEAAHALAVTHGYPRAEALADAISLHLNVTVPLRLGAEAYLLHAGTAMDVTGLRASILPTNVRTEVVTRHPRTGFAAEMAALSARQAAVRPRSRIALLRRLGLAHLIQRGERIFTQPTRLSS
jgi:hypothetical protein